jgi:hypothetical protein
VAALLARDRPGGDGRGRTLDVALSDRDPDPHRRQVGLAGGMVGEVAQAPDRLADHPEGGAAALLARDRPGGDGRGRTLDVALSESVLSMMEGMDQDPAAVAGRVGRGRRGGGDARAGRLAHGAEDAVFRSTPPSASWRHCSPATAPAATGAAAPSTWR